MTGLPVGGLLRALFDAGTLGLDAGDRAGFFDAHLVADGRHRLRWEPSEAKKGSKKP